MSVSDTSAEILSALLLRRAGHPLSSDRQYRIETALGPVLRSRGFGSIDSLVVAMASEPDDQLETEIVEALLNNETYFFRDRTPFELIGNYLQDRVAQVRTNRRISIWCAGVSTGQEAYSLAMLFEDQAQKWRGWHIHILGTDVSALAIKRAHAGLYTQFEVQRGLPTRQLVSHFEKSGANWQISAALRAQVQFLCQDVTRDQAATLPAHDIILCRNLLLYLPPETRREVFSRLRAALAPDGVLVLGAAETILGQTDVFEPDTGYRGLYRAKTPAAVTPSRCSGPGIIA